MLCESGFTQNTCTMGHTGTLTVRPQSPQKESKTQVENALFALKVGAGPTTRTPWPRAMPRRHCHRPTRCAPRAAQDFFSRRKTAVLLGLFREHDANCSGRLELCEFKSAIRQLNLDLGDESMSLLRPRWHRRSGGAPPSGARCPHAV